MASVTWSLAPTFLAVLWFSSGLPAARSQTTPPPPDCLGSPCINGVCDDLILMTCVCFPGFTGPDCGALEVTTTSSSSSSSGSTSTSSTSGSTSSSTDVLSSSVVVPTVTAPSPVYTTAAATSHTVLSMYTVTPVTSYLSSDGGPSSSVVHATTGGGVDSSTVSPSPVQTSPMVPGTTAPNFCSSQPCLNGAYCFSTPFEYVCLCLGGTTGKQCETLISTPPPVSTPSSTSNACSSQPCFNGATCYEGVTFFCACRAGTTGTQCQSFTTDPDSSAPPTATTSSVGSTATPSPPSNPCASDPCFAGGTCLAHPAGGQFSCMCPQRYSGSRCETYYPLLTSTTPSSVATSTGADVCSPQPCSNGGTCIVTPFGLNGFLCVCPLPYTGHVCLDKLPSTQPATTSSFETMTSPPSVPSTSATHPCLSNPCQNGGYCQMHSPSSFNCLCTAGWTGTFCTDTLTSPSSVPSTSARTSTSTSTSTSGSNTCLSNPCQNGGTCYGSPSLTPGFSCLCTAGWTGPFCTDTLISPSSDPSTSTSTSSSHPCASNPCAYGGTCYGSPTSTSGFSCLCTAGWTGYRCFTALMVTGTTSPPTMTSSSSPTYSTVTTGAGNPCQAGTCANGGSCSRDTSSSAGFRCACTPYWTGHVCLTPAPSQQTPSSPTDVPTAATTAPPGGCSNGVDYEQWRRDIEQWRQYYQAWKANTLSTLCSTSSTPPSSRPFSTPTSRPPMPPSSSSSHDYQTSQPSAEPQPSGSYSPPGTYYPSPGQGSSHPPMQGGSSPPPWAQTTSDGSAHTTY